MDKFDKQILTILIILILLFFYNVVTGSIKKEEFLKNCVKANSVSFGRNFKPKYVYDCSK